MITYFYRSCVGVALGIMLCLAYGVDVKAASVRSAHTEVELISEMSHVQPGRDFWVGLRMQMDPHWHSYWLNPGDSGLATEIVWTLPEGVQAGPIVWPTPERIRVPPLMSYGYEGEVLLLTRMSLGEEFSPGTTLMVQADVSWLECKDVCLPGEAHLQLSLPVQNSPAEKNDVWKEAFASTRARVPVSEDHAWRSIKLRPERLMIELSPDEARHGVMFFAEHLDLVSHAEEQTIATLSDGIFLDIPRAPLTNAALPSHLRGVLVYQDAEAAQHSLRIQIPLAPEESEPVVLGSHQIHSVWRAISFAFLGGVILNLMPCVFPIIAIKILGFVAQAGEDRRKVFVHGLLFGAGVLVSFWVLAFLVISLRYGGAQLGWGFQLQSSYFLIVLSLLFFILGLNLIGCFEFANVSFAERVVQAARSQRQHSFLSGVLAAVIATPCTAPFMGAAVGYAFSQSGLKAFIVFTALGFGMALPYCVLSANPGLLRMLPKPGSWMNILKRWMSLPLFLTVVWLLWVLSFQRGGRVVIIVVGCLAWIGVALFLYGRNCTAICSDRQRKTFLGPVIMMMIVGVVLALAAPRLGSQQAQTQENQDGIAWERYHPDRVRELVARGTPFLIDFTAAWCLTCQVNERTTFRSKHVIEAFHNKGLVGLKADWTSRDVMITQALESYGRSGVPLYVLYSGRLGEEPILLPEILTPGILLEKLENIRDSGI